MRTDKQAAVETLEEIADELIRVHTNYKGLWFSKPAIVRNAILSALRNRDERAAKFADAEAQQATRDEALSNDDADRGRCYAAMSIAKAIREGK